MQSTVNEVYKAMNAALDVCCGWYEGSKDETNKQRIRRIEMILIPAAVLLQKETTRDG